MTKETKKTTKTASDYQPTLQKLYKEQVLPALLKEMGVKSPMAAPKLEKIVINIGVKEAREDIKALEIAREDLTAIAGQASQVRRAKKCPSACASRCAARACMSLWNASSILPARAFATFRALPNLLTAEAI